MGFRAILDPSLWWGALRPKSKAFGASTGAPMEFRQVCSINVLCFGNLGTIYFCFSFPGAASDGPCLSGAGDVSTEAEVRHKRRRRQDIITRRFVRLSGQEPGRVLIWESGAEQGTVGAGI